MDELSIGLKILAGAVISALVILTTTVIPIAVTLLAQNRELTSKFTRAILFVWRYITVLHDIPTWFSISQVFNGRYSVWPGIVEEHAKMKKEAKTMWQKVDDSQSERLKLRNPPARLSSWDGPIVEPARSHPGGTLVVSNDISEAFGGLVVSNDRSDYMITRHAELTRYNMNITQKELEAMRTLFEVLVVNRSLAESSPLEAVQRFNVIANVAEEARTIVLLSIKVDVTDLSKYHVHAREVCKVPLLPRSDRALEDKS